MEGEAGEAVELSCEGAGDVERVEATRERESKVKPQKPQTISDRIRLLRTVVLLYAGQVEFLGIIHVSQDFILSFIDSSLQMNSFQKY